MATPLTLKLILAGAAKAVAELKPLDKQSKATAASLRQSRDALRLLNTQAAQIDGLRKQQAELARQSNALKVLRTNLDSVTRTYGAAGDEARKLQGQVDKAKASYDKQRHALVQLRTAATAAGIGNLVADQSRLKSEIDATNAAIGRQKANLDALAQVSGRRTALRQGMERTRGAAGHLAVSGATALGTAYGVRRAVNEPLNQIRTYDTTTERIAALGLGEKDTQRAIDYAKRMKAFGTSMNDNLGLMLDATTAFADVHHAEMVMPTLAKMKFANAAMFGAESGQENEAKFMDMLKVIEARNGLSSEADFIKQADMVQRVITATGGRVDSTQWLDFLKTGGLAARGLRDDAMYYQLEPLVQAMGGNRVGTATMSAYQNVYQGKTTKRAANLMESLGLIADPSKVTHDKAGQIAQLGVGAIKGAELFQKSQFEWMEKVLLPTLAERGITGEKEVLDAIGGIFSNRTASGLFGMMFQMRDQIHKNARLNAGADGIQQLDAKGRKSLSGRELETVARFHDTMQAAGRALLPTYIALLDTAAGALQRITDFAQQNPVLATYIGKAVLWLGLMTVGFGALTLGMAALLGPFAVVRYGLGLFGLKAAGLLPMLGMLGKGLAVGAIAMAKFSLVLLASPITWIVAGIAAIAAGAYLIYRNWEPIKAFFLGLWGSITSGLGNALDVVRTTFGNVMSFLGGLPARFLEAGADMMGGLVSGITSRLAAVREAIGAAADGAIGWFKDKLGIRSPSRVFIEAGQFIGQGAAIGIDRTRPMLRAAALGLAGATAVGMPAMAAGIDTRPPLSAAAGAARAPVTVQGDTITIHITTAAGDDAHAIGRAVRAELDRREAAKAARMRGTFIDYNN